MTCVRLAQGIAGGALVLLGIGDLASIGSSPAVADSDGERHQTMHAMRDAMHGEDTAERMLGVDGAEQMMDQCAGMMDAMGGMSNIERHGMMGDEAGGMMMRGMMGSRLSGWGRGCQDAT